MSGTWCWLLGAGYVQKFITLHIVKYFVLKEMSSYKDLKIYNIAFKLSIRVHLESLKLSAFELYEQGSQIRRSSKGVKDAIA